MKIFSLTYPGPLPGASFPTGQVLAIGDFDGIHLGHQEVIRRAIRSAEQQGLPSAVMTFEPHPRAMFGRSEYGRLLTPLENKLERFAQMGAGYTYVVEFNSAFSQLSPEHFVDGLLVPMRTESVMVGFDFRFGHRAAGTADTLCQLAKGRFSVEVVRPFHLNGEKVSSTSIRELLASGDVAGATERLGRPYEIRGTVVSGDQRGRTIGFPTANLRMDEPYVCPKRGVYAVRVFVRGKTFGGVMNIGFKPTFNEEGTQTLEVHIFDFDDSIYGETVTVQFAAFIRDEQKFPSVQALIEQIRRDAETAKDVLSPAGSRHLL